MASLKKLLPILILAAFCFYAGAFIYRTSFVINGQRYFSLFDDGMISMRYAKNLAAGHGLVWNAGGARVEGFTNPLWTLYMAAFHLLPIATSKMSLCVQITGAALLLANLIFTLKIAQLISRNSMLASATSLLLTAFYLPLNNWALQGMEVSLLTLTVTGCVWLALRGLEAGKFPRGLYLLLGLGTCVRVDMAVVFVAVLLFMIIADQNHRLRHAATGLFFLAVFALAQTASRRWYYGDWLPNTYYLKLTGFPASLRITRGWMVYMDFLLRTNAIIVLLPLAVAFARRDRAVALLLTVFLAQSAYSIYVGGDAWEWYGGSNRYVAIAMPLLFIAYGCGLEGIRNLWESGAWSKNTSDRPVPRLQFPTVALAIVALLSVINVNAITGIRAMNDLLLLRRPLYAESNQSMVEAAHLIEGITDPDATVAVVRAGTLPYFMNRPAVDLLGKSDRVIAHQPMELPPSGAPLATKMVFFYPGHLKHDYKHSIGDLKPDIVAQLWSEPEEAVPFLGTMYRPVTISGQTMYLRKDSPRILWGEVNRRFGK